MGAVAGAALPDPVLAAAVRNRFWGSRPDRYPNDRHVRDYFYKMRHFDRRFSSDVFVEPRMMGTLRSVTRRLRRLQALAGHANYGLLSFDQGLRLARNYPRVGRFTRREIDFLEEIFYADASRYGFLGEKPISSLTHRVKRRDVKKIHGAGGFLYRGAPRDTYNKIMREAGVPAVMTSGIRNVMKQTLLFLNKASRNGGNLSLASRSLAPPGHSFHGTGDFDVGQVGLGAANFTEKFAKTIVFKRLRELGYLKLRYPRDNLSGVRFEPWHIKVKI